MITENQAMEFCERMGACRYFPTKSLAHAEIAQLVMRMVDTPEHLGWLLRSMIDRVGEWKGPKELRGIFCTRFKPRDGIEELSQTSGFTPEDSEMASIWESAERKRLEATPKRMARGLLTAKEIDGLPEIQ